MIGCHPERNLARFLRQMESKDLRFRPSTFSIGFWDGIQVQSLRNEGETECGICSFCLKVDGVISVGQLFEKAAGAQIILT